MQQTYLCLSKSERSDIQLRDSKLTASIVLFTFLLPDRWKKRECLKVLTYQSSLSRALDAIEAYEERRRSLAFAFIHFVAVFYAFENERHAMLGLVVEDLRHHGLLALI